MRRALLLLALGLVWAPAANAAPAVSITASPNAGQAPLQVTLTASGDAATYHWQLGDGTSADGPIVQHRYETGRYVAIVTATGLDGSTARASLTVTSISLSLTGPRIGTYGKRATLTGRLRPALRGAPVSLYSGDTLLRTAKADKKGRARFKIRMGSPASFTARYESVSSNALGFPVRPGLDVALSRASAVGRPLILRAAIRPSRAGNMRVRIWRSGHELHPREFGSRAVVRLNTARVADYVVRISVTPAAPYSARTVTALASVYLPYLSLGDRGPSVRNLERRLAELHYALLGIDGLFTFDTGDAVLAFQKVHGMARTGEVGPAFWRRLTGAQRSKPRYRGGHHIEVDKTRQVLFEVDGGEIKRIVHVSTGATGNTPVGHWYVYSKVPGFLPTGMYDSSFFLRGFAIHGYASVPAYPASHGCVRIPMWIAPSLYASNSYGESIYVYY